MQDFAQAFLPVIGRTTLWLALAALLTVAAVRMSRASWPTAHRALWLLVLLVGWTFVRWSVAVPWYEPVAAPAVDLVQLGPVEPGNMPLDDGEPSIDPILASPPIVALPPDSPPSASPPVAGRPARPFDWPLAVFCAWALGIVALPAVWLLGYVRFVRALPTGLPADKAWDVAWRELLAAQGVRRAIPLRVTSDLGPMLCRLPRDYELLLPERLWRELNAGQREAILRHELAHYTRGDVWKSLAARALALPHWFNPFAWWAVRRFDEAAEWACDLAAVADEGTTDYAKALVRLGEVATLPTMYGSAARGRTLATRVRRLLASPAKQDSNMKKTLLVGAILCFASLSLVHLQLVAQQPPGEKKSAANPVQAEKGPAADDVPDADDDGRKSLKGMAPAQRMVASAKRAFEATEAAFQAETTTLEPVIYWSQRWMAADESLAKDDAQRTAAVKAHLDRMRQLHASIEMLYTVGTKGGEAKEMAAMDYYVAEAERRLEQLQARQTSDAPTAVRQGVAWLEANQSPPPGPARYSKASGPKGTSSNANRSGSPQAATTATRASAGNKKPRLYEGKNFDSWSELFQTELSPAKRTEAAQALTAFAATSHAREVAKQFLEAMHGLSIGDVDHSDPEGQLMSAIMEAFRKIPHEEALPVVLEGLKTGNANQRLFALAVLPVASGNLKEAASIFREALADKDSQVRRMAISGAAVLDPAAPQLAEALRAELASGDLGTTEWAVFLIAGAQTGGYMPMLSGDRLRPLPSLAPDVINVLASTDPDVRASAGRALLAMGEAAVPALKQAYQSSDDNKLAERVDAISKAIERNKAGQPPELNLP